MEHADDEAGEDMKPSAPKKKARKMRGKTVVFSFRASEAEAALIRANAGKTRMSTWLLDAAIEGRGIQDLLKGISIGIEDLGSKMDSNADSGSEEIAVILRAIKDILITQNAMVERTNEITMYLARLNEDAAREKIEKEMARGTPRPGGG